MNLFVDTSAFISLSDKSDNFHLQAIEFVKSFKPNFRLYTTNFILDETITHLRIHANHLLACCFRENIIRSPIYHIQYITSEIEEEAYNLFKKYHDKQLSFTDCTSFAIMNRLRLTTTFTFDSDFEQVGFNKLPVY